jgi:hypothetical protein
MIISNISSASQGQRSAQTQSLCIHTTTRIAAPLLIAAFLLAGVPVSGSASTSTNDHISNSSSLPTPACNGNCPGLCSDPPDCG